MAHKANTFCRANTILVRRPGLPTNGNPIDKRPQARPIGPRSGPRPIRGLAGPIPSAGPTKCWYDVPGLPPMGIPLKNGHRQGRSALGQALSRYERAGWPCRQLQSYRQPITRGPVGGANQILVRRPLREKWCTRGSDGLRAVWGKGLFLYLLNIHIPAPMHPSLRAHQQFWYDVPLSVFY